MSETELRANIITFIAAGHETTANAVMWSLFLLSQSRCWTERVVTEAYLEAGAAIEDRADRLVETRAVIEEAIRLYPPIAAITRAAINGDELARVAIKPRAMVVIAPYVLHRHRQLSERPNVFDPLPLPRRGKGLDQPFRLHTFWIWSTHVHRAGFSCRRRHSSCLP